MVSPLVEAVSYPDRRVRFAAAFALAEVRPKKPFRGSQKVVPALAEALNLGTGKSVLLAESESDNRNQLKNALQGAGYCVVAVDTGKAAVESAETMPRLDVVLLSSKIKPADYGEVIKILRNAYATELTPIVVLSWPDDPFKASDLKAKFKYLDVVDADSELAEVENTIKDLAAAVGAMTFEDDVAEALSIRAVTVLKNIAATNTVYEARGARQVLLDALSDRPDRLTILALAALAEIADPEITREIATVATGADTAAEVRLAALGSLTRAIRFAGNHLTPATVEQLRKMTAEEDNKLRNAVATVLGAMNLPPEDGAKIILQYGAR
ncbi:MAG: hypothetical protein QF662_05875 [Phycisphaerae bacterium]|nr:hypothetical protein [Phycisphaerae bacterium]